MCHGRGEQQVLGPCIMQIMWDYVKTLCSSSLSRAKSSVGPGQFGGEMGSHTDGDTEAPATSGGCPLTPFPTVPTGISVLFLALLAQRGSSRKPKMSPALPGALLLPRAVGSAHLQREVLGMCQEQHPFSDSRHCAASPLQCRSWCSYLCLPLV